MKLLTVEEAARVLRVKPWTVREWLKTGRLRGIRLGKAWRIDGRDLEACIKGHRPEENTNKGENAMNIVTLHHEGRHEVVTGEEVTFFHGTQVDGPHYLGEPPMDKRTYSLIMCISESTLSLYLNRETAEIVHRGLGRLLDGWDTTDTKRIEDLFR